MISHYVILFDEDAGDVVHRGYEVFREKRAAMRYIEKNQSNWKHHYLYRSYEVEL